jgi:hypothetical protein
MQRNVCNIAALSIADKIDVVMISAFPTNIHPPISRLGANENDQFSRPIWRSNQMAYKSTAAPPYPVREYVCWLHVWSNNEWDDTVKLTLLRWCHESMEAHISQ